MKKITKKMQEQLVAEATKASQSAYAPYSGFRVGAALLSLSGKIYRGCNVENASYSLTVCAERNAYGCAVEDGEMSFAAIAVYVDNERTFPPCGACRQVMAEFSDDLWVIIANNCGYYITTLGELLPGKFSL